MGGAGHVREGEDQRMPKGGSEAQIAVGVDWGVSQPSQILGACYLMIPRLLLKVIGIRKWLRTT
jgi:hypothetical protein